MFEPSWEKLLIVLVIALIVLGPKKLPEIGRSLGHGIREFKDGVTNKEHEHNSELPSAALESQPASPAYTPPVAEPAHAAPASGDHVRTHSE
jgi:sec-independent protein translocase protein TatA